MRLIYNNTVFNTVQVDFWYLLLVYTKSVTVVLSCPFYWKKSLLPRHSFGLVRLNTEQCQTLQTTMCQCNS